MQGTRVKGVTSQSQGVADYIYVQEGGQELCVVSIKLCQMTSGVIRVKFLLFVFFSVQSKGLHFGYECNIFFRH